MEAVSGRWAVVAGSQVAAVEEQLLSKQGRALILR
jgi:hypothetical protein